MADEKAIEMYVGGLVLDPATQSPIVVLKDEKGDLHLPIWIGMAEATSIASAIKQLQMTRPLTHDLMWNVLNEIGVTVQQIVITDLKESTYFAEIILSFGDKMLIVDARPSDAIGLAIRAEAPIMVAQKVLERAKVAFSELPSEREAFREKDENVDEQSDRDFQQIDKDEWTKILDDLDPDDFKYKV